LLGALALGDIGKHFPDDDMKFKNADSGLLLSEVLKMIEGKGYAVCNVDSVLMMQKPKISSYVDEMRKKIADRLKVAVDRISIKATTTERLGFTGREEGVAAMASVLLIKV
jgi:2-C-methyl-D-erythritol 2,4-cyclodiphosphate synthase